MPAVRRLAAILATDVAGYSRLMGADEEGTHQRLQAHLRDLIDPKITEHHGRVVKRTGDGFLAEFPSVVNAVRCAVEVQRGTLERNAGTPPEKRIEFRVGINLGDVIVEEHDIFGDGVNVAARLEGLAEPGGVCVSRVVRDEIRDKLPYPFEDRGEQSVKNIARPVHAFALSAAAVAITPLVPVNPLASAVVTKASSLPEEFSLQFIIGAQIIVYTVDATLIDKGTPGTETVSDLSGQTYTVPTSMYIFAFDNGKHYPIKLTNFELPFAIGVRVTFLLFKTPQRKEILFSVYNHSEQGWRNFPFEKNIDLGTEQERKAFGILIVVSSLIPLVAVSWSKESSQIVFPLWATLVALVAFAFMVRNWLRKKLLISRRKRLQDHVKII
jgi:class 3 adenylate cyclase